ncbi:MAG: UDP-3-O-(3-hydroxymyristoyl)glucosamine N-acyltransferase [Terriglobales bacterium]
MNLAQIASTLGARLENGSPETEITGVAGIEEAGTGQITFVANPKYAAAARTTKAAAVIVADDFPAIPSAMLRSKNPYLTFARAIALFHQPHKYAPGIHPTAVVHPSARIEEGAHLGPYVVIGENVEIGRHAVLLAHVVIYHDAKIGDNFFAHAHAVVREGCRVANHVLLQNGAVIGADGFGFAKDDAGRWHKIPQPQPVVIQDDVEIQANSCIDRASVGETRIGSGVKIDNLAQIGHGSKIGDNTLVCAQVGLAGSSEIGKSAILAGQAGVAGHCRLGDGVIMTAQSGVSHDVPDGKIISGSPAFDNRQWLRATAIFARLPDIVKQLQRREKS